jgi:putative addiction module component (TIGR02574 family)
MTTTDIRKDLHEFIDAADENRLKAIYEILQIVENREFEISDEHKAILDSRLKAYYENPTDVLTWEEVKAKYKKL